MMSPLKRRSGSLSVHWVSDLPVKIWLCMERIAQDLEPKYIYDQLRQDQVICITDVEMIESEITSVDKARSLLKGILKQSDDKIELFKDALNETYPFLCLMIEDTPVTDNDRSDFLAFMIGIGSPRIPLHHKDETYFNFESSKKDLLSMLRQRLRDVYSTDLMWMYPVPWNDDVRVKTRDIYSDCCFSQVDELQRLQEFNKSDGDAYEKLSLTGSKAEKIKRILIEGEPGSGKSAFCQQLVLDWAENPDGKLAQNYDLVLYFPANTLDEYLPISVKNTFVPDDSDLSFTEIGCLLLDPDIQKKILILVDGYDEIKQTSYVDEIWHRKKVHDCTLLVTARPGFPRHKTKPMQVKYILEGLTEQGVSNYTEQYAKCFGCNPLVIHGGVQAFGRLLREIKRNPLCLSLVALVVDDNVVDEELPSSKTQLFQEVVEMCIERGTEKTKAKLGDEYCEDMVNKCVTDMLHVAWQSITSTEKKLLSHWKYEDPSAKILCAMGILVPVKGQKKLRPTIHVEFLHRVFQEYFAAQHLAKCTASDLSQMIDKLNIVQHQYIFVFLSGLLRNDESRLEAVYKELIGKTTSYIYDSKFKIDCDDRRLGWHHPTHLLLECIGESGYVPVLQPGAYEAFPKCITYSMHCISCLKGLSLTNAKHDIDCAVIVTYKSLKYLMPMDNLKKFIVRSRNEKNLCLSLAGMLKKFKNIQHLFVYLVGPRSQCPDTTTTTELDRLCKEYPNTVETMVWNYICTTSISPDENPMYIADSLLHLIGPNLKHLVLNGCIIDKDILRKLSDPLRKHKSIVSLQISETLFLDCDTSEALQAFSDLPQIENIHTEYLMDSRMQTYRNMLNKNTSGTNFPEPMYFLFANQNIKHIHIENQKVGSEDHVVKCLANNVNTLQTLSLHNFALDFKFFNNWRLIGHISSPKLEQICLSRCTTMAQLLPLVQRMTNVQQLDLSLNPIGHEMRQLVSALVKLPKLVVLLLEECDITDKCLHLLKPLLQKGTLKIISLAQNRLMCKEESISHIEDLFGTSCSLTHVFISLRKYSLSSALVLAKTWNKMDQLKNINILTSKTSADTVAEVKKQLKSSIEYAELSPYSYYSKKAGRHLHPYLRNSSFTNPNQPNCCFELRNMCHI